ncbi:putative 30S ribosomal protein S17-like protein [Fusarium oxysporum f. sp. conglutinans]|nr:putative 30S ribosomal protein S17-like protein [Fusarium oxysporum f. sp. conglutinans]
MDLQQALQEPGTGEEDMSEALSTLAMQAYERFLEAGYISDIHLAVETARLGLKVVPDTSSHKAGHLNKLGVFLGSRYERTGEMEDLEEAISISIQVVNLTSDDHPHRAGYLHNLGSKLGRRYKQTGDVEDLEEAIKIARQAVNIRSDDHPHRAEWLSNLANRLESRYELTGDMEDLEEAIRTASQAVDATPHDHADRAGWLSNLGNKFQRRYERTGELRDLEEAIKIARQAVDVTPDDHPDRAGWLSNLGSKLGSRYERTGEMADLEEAITTSRQAVNLTSDDHVDRTAKLNNLGSKLVQRYERIGEVVDLEEAIRIARQVVNLTPDGHIDRAARLSNLGNMLQSRYEQKGKMEDRKMEDLEEAIRTVRQAVNLTSDDHPDRACWLSNLANKLQSKYERTGKMENLEEAITMARQAVNLTSEDHPDRACWLRNLGNKLESRYERTGEMRDLEEASAYLLEAWSCLNAVPFHRVMAAARCLKLLAKQHRVAQSIDLGRRILDLLPSVHTRALNRNDQQFVVSTFAGIASNLCSFLLSANRLSEALECLEQGRTIIISRLLDDRSDLSSLRQDHFQLANRYQSLVDEVNAPTRQTIPGVIETLLRKRRQEAAVELDMCLKEIRRVSGHERFMLGQTVAEMQECITEGSIVVYICLGCFAWRYDSYIVSCPSQAALRNCFNKQGYIEAVVGLLTRRRLPFSAVEHSELRDLALACNPAIGDLLINDRKQAMGYINSNYSLYSSQLAERLQTTQSKIHISSDLWTSPHRHGVLAVCVQWVDEDFKLQKALLGLPECKYSHSGATQAELIAGTLRKFNITAQSLGYYIGDNATSNDTCLEELSKVLEAESGAEYPHKRRRIRCIGHIINLALQAFLLARSKEALRAALEATADEPGSTMLEEFSQQLHELDPAEIAAHSDTTTHQEKRQEERQEQPTRKPTHARGKRAATTHQQASNVDERFAGWQGIPALAKLHALAVYIRSSALHNDQWYDAVGKQLGIDNITRWSSWHRVITVALKKKPQIIQFTAEHDNDLEGNTLSSRDWEMLERTLEFLQPFYEATLEAEGAMASISQSLELLDLLLGHCEKWKAHYSQPSNRDDRIIHSIDMCWFILDKYYTMTEDVPVYAAALLLDPSKRKSYIEECWPEEWHEGAFAAARSLWKEEYNYDVEIHLSEQSLAVPALLKRKKDTMLSKMRLEVRNKTMARARGKDDFDSFISEAPIALAEDTTPLQWWCSEDVRTAYPRLSRMAIDILSVPAESAEPERTFSGARRTARWDRLRLLIESIEKIECIGNWLREGHIRPSAEGGIGLLCDPEAIEGDI